MPSASRRHRVLLSVAGASHGHLYPLLPLARALDARGHSVAVGAAAHFSDVVTEAGLAAIPLVGAEISPPSDEYKARQMSRNPLGRGRAAVARYLDQGVAEALPLLSAARDWRATVIVRETTAYAGWFAAELTGLPLVVVDFVGTPPRLLAAVLGDLFLKARRRLGLTDSLGLPSLNGHLHLLPGPPRWFPEAAIGPASLVVQPAESPAPDSGALACLDQMPKNRPLVYVSLGTMWSYTPHVLENVIAVLGEEPVNAIVSLGPNVDEACTGALPPNVRVERFFPQAVEAAILSKAAIIVSHGGNGSLMNGLRHGLAIIVIPLATSDALTNGRRVEALGVGTVSGESRDALRRSVRRILGDRRYVSEAKRVSSAIRVLPKLSSAAPLVEWVATHKAACLDPAGLLASLPDA